MFAHKTSRRSTSLAHNFGLIDSMVGINLMGCNKAGLAVNRERRILTFKVDLKCVGRLSKEVIPTMHPITGGGCSRWQVYEINVSTF